MPCRSLEEEHPFLTVFDSAIYSDFSLQWWSTGNRCFQAWGKTEAICLQNDIAEIYFKMERSELHFNLHSMSGDDSEIHRFSHRK